MKFIFSQMSFFLTQQSNRRNLRFMRNFFFLLIGLIALYTALFHSIMLEEGKNHSLITGLYWTLTVMSTLGFGDITFTSDIGRLFSLVVLLSGIILIMLIMPFTFIRFLYVPWLEAQNNARTPSTLPDTTKGHTLIIGSDSVACSIADKMQSYGLPYFMVVDDPNTAFSLYDKGYSVVKAETDTVATYKNIRADNAALVVAVQDEYKNTNIAATLREITKKTRLVATADHDTAESVLYLAGCNNVFCFPSLLGQSMGRRVRDVSMRSHNIGHFEDLYIAEAPVTDSSLAGKTIMQANLKDTYGLNVAGIWQGNHYTSVYPNTVIHEGDILLLAGTDHALKTFDAERLSNHDTPDQAPVIILGGGRVGKSVAQALDKRKIAYTLVDKNQKILPVDDKRGIEGDASSLQVLTLAGIEKTPTVVITTHNDDVNIYLTIFCRKLRPDIQIISRASMDRNVASLYNAGATVVMSQSSYTAHTITNLLKPNQVVMLTEGLNVFRITVPSSLLGKTLLESEIRQKTNCNVMAVSRNGTMEIPAKVNMPFNDKDELILIGTVESEVQFRQEFDA